jgi:hypothetical protein
VGSWFEKMRRQPSAGEESPGPPATVPGPRLGTARLRFKMTVAGPMVADPEGRGGHSRRPAFEYSAGGSYDVPVDLADQMIIKNYADGELNRDYLESEIQEIRDSVRTITPGRPNQ